MDMWTMRWRAPAPTVDNADALPTAGAFDHMITASHDREKSTQRTPRADGADPAQVGQIYFGESGRKWVRIKSALTEIRKAVLQFTSTESLCRHWWRESLGQDCRESGHPPMPACRELFLDN